MKVCELIERLKRLDPLADIKICAPTQRGDEDTSFISYEVVLSTSGNKDTDVLRFTHF